MLRYKLIVMILVLRVNLVSKFVIVKFFPLLSALLMNLLTIV